MRVLLITILLSIQMQLLGQNFITNLYFEDSLGNRDTLMFGRSEEGTYDMDEELGEIDIQEDSLKALDVRFFQLMTYNINEEYDIGWRCTHQDGDVSVNGNDLIREYIYETKVSVVPLIECLDDRRTYFDKFFIPTNAAFPITIRWDNLLYQDSCNAEANISELPFYCQCFPHDNFCPERINYPFISLNSMDSIILEQPNFLTFLRADSTLVSPYYIRIPHNKDGMVLSTRQEVLQEALPIYPNPIEDKLYLETTEQGWSYKILNLQGQQIMQGQYQDSIGVSQLPSGIYFLQLSRENELYKAIKFVKE